MVAMNYLYRIFYIKKQYKKTLPTCHSLICLPSNIIYVHRRQRRCLCENVVVDDGTKRWGHSAVMNLPCENLKRFSRRWCRIFFTGCWYIVKEIYRIKTQNYRFGSRGNYKNFHTIVELTGSTHFAHHSMERCWPFDCLIIKISLIILNFMEIFLWISYENIWM